MTLAETKKLSKHICRLLKVSDMTFPIGRTPSGNLGIVFNQNNDDFEIMLDSIPLSTKSILEDENNIELKKMIEKYLFEDELELIYKAAAPEEVSPAKKKGRPAGSKKKVNGKKAH